MMLSALLLVLPLLVARTTAEANHAAAGRQRIVARALSHRHRRRGCCRSTYRLGDMMLSALLSALALLLQRSTLAAAVAARIAVNRRHIDSHAPPHRPYSEA